MIIGIPKERKTLEGRVALIPQSCAQLIRLGHQVVVETTAGELSGYRDDDYLAAGASIAATPAALYQQAALIVKVKEPVEFDLPYLQAHHTLFCFLHLAALPQLAQQLCQIGLTAIGFETVETEQNQRPLLAPMSKVAGRLSVQIGSYLLHQPQGGRGILLGGIEQAEPGHIVVLGGGIAGEQALKQGYALGAELTVFDLNSQRLAELSRQFPGLRALPSDAGAIAAAVKQADLLVGSVLLPAAHAPRIVSEALVKEMKPGSVIIDISVDQGGCIETIHPTTYENPTYVVHEILHFGVTNMPGAVPRTSSQVLSEALEPYVAMLAADTAYPPIMQAAINIEAGRVIHPVLLKEFG